MFENRHSFWNRSRFQAAGPAHARQTQSAISELILSYPICSQVTIQALGVYAYTTC